MACPDEDMVLRYISGTAEDESGRSIEEHASGCATCAKRIEVLRSLQRNLSDVCSDWTAAGMGLAYRRWRKTAAGPAVESPSDSADRRGANEGTEVNPAKPALPIPDFTFATDLPAGYTIEGAMSEEDESWYDDDEGTEQGPSRSEDDSGDADPEEE